jgi:hypothetical protein
VGTNRELSRGRASRSSFPRLSALLLPGWRVPLYTPRTSPALASSAYTHAMPIIQAAPVLTGVGVGVLDRSSDLFTA